jgi:hypothetical protein
MLDVEEKPNPSKRRSFGSPQAPPRDHHNKGNLLLKDLQGRWREEGDRVGGEREATPSALVRWGRDEEDERKK